MEVLNKDIIMYRQFDIENWTKDLLFARNEIALCLFQSSEFQSFISKELVCLCNRNRQ